MIKFLLSLTILLSLFIGTSANAQVSGYCQFTIVTSKQTHFQPYNQCEWQASPSKNYNEYMTATTFSGLVQSCITSANTFNKSSGNENQCTASYTYVEYDLILNYNGAPNIIADCEPGPGCTATHVLKEVSGQLTEISSAADGTVVGVNAGLGIFRYNGGNSWSQIPGQLTDISAGSSSHIWGVNATMNGGNNVFEYAGNNNWTGHAGYLTNVSVNSSGVVWGVNTNLNWPGNDVFRYNGNNTWVGYQGWLSQISVANDGTVAGTNCSLAYDPDNGYNCDRFFPGGQVFTYNGNGGWNYHPAPVEMMQIAAASANLIYGLGTDGNLYSFNGSSWTLMVLPPMQLDNISASPGNLWILGESRSFYGGPNGSSIFKFVQ